jgi:hypothetical protein
LNDKVKVVKSDRIFNGKTIKMEDENVLLNEFDQKLGINNNHLKKVEKNEEDLICEFKKRNTSDLINNSKVNKTNKKVAIPSFHTNGRKNKDFSAKFQQETGLFKHNWQNPDKSIMKPFLEAITEYDMISEGNKILICLSGGKDSMSLLHAIKQYQYIAKSKVNIMSYLFFFFFWFKCFVFKSNLEYKL